MIALIEWYRRLVMRRPTALFLAVGILLPGMTVPCVQAGPYAQSYGPSSAIDAPIPGFVGPEGDGKINLDGEGSNYVNPIFKVWANEVVEYAPAPGIDPTWVDQGAALGPVTGDNFHIVCLGDLFDPNNPPKVGTKPPYTSLTLTYSGNLADPNDGWGFVGYDEPGRITLKFPKSISNAAGPDLAVFENGFIVANDGPSYGAVAGQTWAELAYVEVSTDGIVFARFPSISLTNYTVPNYGSLEPTNIYNLAGKSINAYGESWGTPFDLSTLTDNPLVVAGFVNIEEINYVRIIDIPGSGLYKDSEDHPIYDSWVTLGSGGFDLEAVGLVNVIAPAPKLNAWRQQYFGTPYNLGDASDRGNPSGDGVPNLLKYATGEDPTVSGKPPGKMALSGGYISFTYQRNKSALDEVTCVVEWSDDLISWSTQDVVEDSIEDKGENELVHTTIPKSNGSKRFVRLKVGRKE